MLHRVSIKAEHFDCFGSVATGFDAIKPINVIVGRNNSGKSTLLDLIEFAVSKTSLDGRQHAGRPPRILLSGTLTGGMADRLPSGPVDIYIPGNRVTFVPSEFAQRHLIGRRLTYSLTPQHETKYHAFDEIPKNNYAGHKCDHVGHRAAQLLGNPFSQYVYRKISADRDIHPEGDRGAPVIAPNGDGLTHTFERIINLRKYDRDVIECTLLEELNRILHPDSCISRIHVQQNEDGNWEVLLEEDGKGRIPLSRTGSGIKTVILVLANLIVVPMLEGKDGGRFIYAFEEIENNLHPAVQRRLFRYLRQHAIDNGCYIFVTTHSSVAIDLFAGDERAQIIHVEHDGECATARTVASYEHSCGVLDDLGARASDLLQANGIVWVEGPSDRIYFNRWIELWSDGQLVEGIDYQCLPYGGAINAHLSYSAPEEIAELVSALKINRNAILLIDSDKRMARGQLKKHTRRLREEINAVNGFPWVTAGREVENYIPSTTLTAWLGDKVEAPGPYDDVIAFVARCRGVKSVRKVQLASDIAPGFTKEELASTLDLAKQLDRACRVIQSWNDPRC